MKWILKKIDGYKSKSVMVVTAVLGAMVALEIPIPAWVWPVLAAAGLGAVRSAIKKAEI